MPKQTINYALAATLLAQHVTLEEAAKQVGAKNANTLKVGLARRGVTATLARRSDDQTSRAVMVATRAVNQASEALRADLASVLAKHVGALSEIPAKPNLKHIKAVGDAMEPLTRTAKIVHDWGSEQPNALVVAGLFSEPKAQAVDQPAAIEIPSEAQRIEDAPKPPPEELG